VEPQGSVGWLDSGCWDGGQYPAGPQRKSCNTRKLLGRTALFLELRKRRKGGIALVTIHRLRRREYLPGLPGVRVDTEHKKLGNDRAKIDDAVPNGIRRIGFVELDIGVRAFRRGSFGREPERDFLAGYAEVVKYGLLGDAGFFAWLEAKGPALRAGDPAARVHAVRRSCEMKAGIVARDETEQGERALLNLGHTFGHALEAQTGFSERLLHGEGVALGMVLAARYSARRGYISDDDAARVTAAIDAAGLPSEVAALGLNCGGRQLADHMLHDKKMDAGTLPFVLLRGIGEAFLDKAVSLDDIGDFLDEQLRAH